MIREQARRAFMRKMALGSLGLMWSDTILADPLQRLIYDFSVLSPVRVRGRVTDGEKGIAGVSVSDGLNVVQSGRDGQYELLSSSERPLVWISVPGGYDFPVRTNSIAQFYKPLAGNKKEVKASWIIKPMVQNDNSHGFIVMADPQPQDMDDMKRFQEETIPDVIKILSTYSKPFFNLSCGDIMWDNLELYDDFERAINRVGFPGFQVVGNHDLDVSADDEGSVVTFMNRFGPNYYSFNRGEIHYVVLDDVYWFGSGYRGYIDDIQLKWLENDLTHIEKGRRVVVFTHIPVYNLQFVRNGDAKPGERVVVSNRDRLYRILETYKVHIITGHTHVNDYFEHGGASHHNYGTACGAWWTGDICSDGTPNGYVLYEAKGSALSWKYKSTGKPLTHQMRIYEKGTDPSAPGEIVVNIWGATDKWIINIYEDGIRKERMERRTGLDPLSVKLHKGQDLPAKRSWVEPTMTAHLYYAHVSDQEHEITVEAISESGEIYVEKLIKSP